MAAIEATDAGVGAIAGGRFGKLIEKTADQMSQRVTAEGVAAEQDDVDRQDECADPDPEGSFARRGIDEPERFPDIVQRARG